MASAVLPKAAIDELKCINCSLYISFGPVTCGRCPNEAGEPVAIYENVARFINFPCIDAQGCERKFPFGEEMKTHEACCPYKQNMCPMGSCRNCEFRGSSKTMLKHLVLAHPDNFLEKPEVKIHLSTEAKNKRFLFATRGGIYVINLSYTQRGLSLEVMQFSSSICVAAKTYEIVLRPYRKSYPSYKFQREISKYAFAINIFNIPDITIDANILRYMNCQKTGMVDTNVNLQWDSDSSVDKSIRYLCKHLQFG